ncbi:chemotaxis-specific protein-glutamate methyltransferase CheB [Estrella lausannensis]|uniref:Protein-glutamate methylesterase/protein-glutamine glutaminase n=1 Tax=Estrella lausannensis TaxID=483423 RepID=A0A0H5DSL1_9BACT|nr:chemotaxis-specific protein-glutamate methyltransferase CheB [Estrella lausannensis]CRX39298.1 Chemotaxis response regulator protein-glutamate methylesterase [Estrella lausannensis]
MQENKLIKVLIVDDSTVASRFLAHVIESDPKIKVIGFAADGEKALDMLAYLTPDVITMDISMPRLDGFDTTERIMRIKPIPIVMVSGLYASNDLEAAFKAMEAGALAILSRPVSIEDPNYEKMAKSLIGTIKTVAEVKVVTRNHGRGSSSAGKAPLKAKEETSIQAIGIGASLGGPLALEKILSTLPANFPVPLFIVQHISSGFAEGFAKWLQKNSALKIRLPQNEETAKPGFVYVAPDNKHMVVGEKGKIFLKEGKEKEICPSVDRLFQSLSTTYKRDVMGVILTGMGRDGAQGLLEMRKSGALTVSQSEDDCVMYSMPKAAVEIGASQSSMNLDEIAALILKAALGKGNG